MRRGAIKGQYGQQPNTFEPPTILERIVTEPNSGCWIWIGPVNDSGYGKLTIQYKDWTAHRASYKIFKGEIPKGMFVLHRCDVPACVNPDHLYLGDAKQNSKDMISRGRSAIGDKNTSRKNPHLQVRGSKSAMSKLTEEDVLEIKRRLSLGESQKIIAKDFPVTSNTICEINRGRVWKHVVYPTTGVGYLR